MISLGLFTRAEALVLLSGFLLTIGFLLLNGRVCTAGLLNNKRSGSFDPGRLQLLVTTVLVAGLMLTRLNVMRETRTITLPSSELLFGVGGSHAFYLVRKFLQQRLPR